MIKAVIFDMDGVIIDSEPLHFESDRMLMRDFGIVITDEELNSYVGVTNPQMWAELKEKYNLNASIDELLKRQYEYKKSLFGNGNLQAIKGIPELLLELKDKGISIGLASSSSREFIELILRKLNIYECFDVIVSGEEIEKSKPAPDIFLKTAGLLKVNPHDCIVIEDSGHGVCAAKSAGMKCIAYKNPNSGIQDLSKSDVLVYSLEKLNYSKI